jgi:DNA-binding XRE family transcriptional regulator
LDEIALQFYLDDFRKSICSVRQKLGIAVEQMCSALEITRQSLSNFESERGAFKLVNALAISTVFDYFMSESKTSAEILNDFAVSRVDYADYILSSGPPPSYLSLASAWHKKRAQYGAGGLPEIAVGEKEAGKLILFVDIFSFINDEIVERFLWWMIRVSAYKAGSRLEMYIDNTISDPQILSKEERAAHILNAISDVKQHGLMSLHAMNLRGMEFLQGVRAVVSLKGYEPENCVVVSSDIWTLSGCASEKPAVLSADGLMLNMAGMDDVISRIKKDDERKIEAKLAAIPAKLLSRLFDS